MKLHLTPRRHARALAPGEKPPTPEEKLAQIAYGRQRLVRLLLRRFPQVKVRGIVDQGTVLIEVPDDQPGLVATIRSELDCETGPPDLPDAMLVPHQSPIR